MARARETWAAGATIPGTHYRIVGLLGRGGFGEVYEVEHVHLTRRFAVKVLCAAHAGRGDLIERLKREARALARLHPHPNLVEVTDLRESADGRPFLVMERLRGRTLADAADGRPVDLGLAADVMRQLLRALGAAHRLGLVHRDVKPSNVFLCDDGAVKLLDFGIVKVLTEKGSPQTVPGTAVGTPGYMAPEYIEGGTPDARSDVYSAGVVFWEMLAGRSPFDRGPSGHDLLVRAVTAGVPPLEDAGGADAPPGVRAVVRRATALRPADRYASADDFAADLEAALRHGDVPRPARVLKAPPAPPAPHPSAPPAPPRARRPSAPPANARALGPSPDAPPAPARRASDAPPAPTRRASEAPPAPTRRAPGGATATPPPAADDPTDTVRALFDGHDGGDVVVTDCESLQTLFDAPLEGVDDASPDAGEPDEPNPDRVEHAIAFLPTPPSVAGAARRARRVSRRVVLDPPRPGSHVPGEAASSPVAFAPTLPSAAAVVPPPLPPPARRAPAPSTAEVRARELPTPTAVPAPPPPPSERADDVDPRRPPTPTTLRLFRPGPLARTRLAALALAAAAIGLGAALARAHRPETPDAALVANRHGGRPGDAARAPLEARPTAFASATSTVAAIVSRPGVPTPSVPPVASAAFAPAPTPASAPAARPVDAPPSPAAPFVTGDATAERGGGVVAARASLASPPVAATPAPSAAFAPAAPDDAGPAEARPPSRPDVAQRPLGDVRPSIAPSNPNPNEDPPQPAAPAASPASGAAAPAARSNARATSATAERASSLPPSDAAAPNGASPRAPRRREGDGPGRGKGKSGPKHDF